MQRVNLGKPYEDFIQKQVASGYYASASEVIRDALRSKMVEDDFESKKTLRELVAESEEDVKNGRVTKYDANLWKTINANVKKNIKNNKPIPDHVRP